MRIESLAVSGLYGHLSFEKRFDPYLSFLIGINGSGKTSALNVLAWTLFPSFRRLSRLEFSEIRISYRSGTRKGKKREVTARRLDDNIEMTISDEPEPLLVPVFESIRQEYSVEGRERPPTLAEMYDRFTVEKRDHPVLRALMDLVGPLYLPLDRWWEQEGRGLLSQARHYRAEYYRSVRSVPAGIVGPVLYLAEKYYRERQSELSQLNEVLREEIVASTFSVATSFPTRVPEPWTKEQVQLRRARIAEGLRQTGIRVPEKALADYFKGLEKIASALESKGVERGKQPPQEFFDWLMNIPQVEWIENVMRRIDDYNKKREATLRRIESFLRSVNSFLCDSGKQIRFDPSGEIVVQMGKKHEIRADNLSSGETQLLTLFTYLYFAFPEEQEFVVMIDEPELSLHPKWQHQYVDSVVNANPNVQFILATHSPEIVQRHRARCIEMTLES